MKRIISLVLGGLLTGILLYGCIDDETTGFQTEGSPITITVADTNIYQDFGLMVTISPDITQLSPGLPLKYEWKAIGMDNKAGSDSLRLIGTEKELNYKFPRSGLFKVRLRVENQYGSSFKNFWVNVEAPFEQGILIISNDENGKGRISFLRLKNEDEVLTRKNTDFNTDGFRQSNADVELRGVRDAVVTSTDKILVLGGAWVMAVSSETDAKIYMLNTQDFRIQNIIDIGENCPGMFPTTLCSSDYTGVDKMVFATTNAAGEKGDMGIVNLTSYVAYPDRDFFAGEENYDKIIFGYYEIEGWSGLNYIGCFIDNSRTTINVVINGSDGFTEKDRFTGQHIINGALMEKEGDLVFITSDKNDPNKIRVYKTQEAYYWRERGKIEFEGDPYEYTLQKEFTLSSDCMMCTNTKYQHIYYYKGNKLYRWVYRANIPQLPDDADFILPDPNDEITYIGLSPDQEHIYLCVYNPLAKTELKGKLLIINADKMTIENTFEGISDKALKVMWKSAY